MRSLILRQCRDLRIGVTREDLGALTTVRGYHIVTVTCVPKILKFCRI